MLLFFFLSLSIITFMIIASVFFGVSILIFARGCTSRRVFSCVFRVCHMQGTFETVPCHVYLSCTAYHGDSFLNMRA